MNAALAELFMSSFFPSHSSYPLITLDQWIRGEKRAVHQDSQQQHQAVCRETWPWAPVDILARQRSGEEMVSGQKHLRFAEAQPES